MSANAGSELLRCTIFHTPRNPFRTDGALECFADGGLLISNGRIADCDEYSAVRDRHREVAVTDWRGGFLLPGLVDTHVHFPQVRVLGGMGRPLLEWLQYSALPEELRMASATYAQQTARVFVHSLASMGTTTALVFGSHFASATSALFEAAANAGLRMISGLVLSDRMLLPELHQRPEAAYRVSGDMIRRFHRAGRLRYAVTPRFALSASEAMLQVCQTLLQEHEDLFFQTHLNENTAEVLEVASMFPWAEDYLGVYERYGCLRAGCVMAHNVHATDGELARLAASGAAVAHCPSSNAALASGIFPMRRHLDFAVPFALGTDVGAGTGFGILKEALQSYLMQRVAKDGVNLRADHLLYLATKGGAEALAMSEEIGDFKPGKAADFVYLRPPMSSALEWIAKETEDLPKLLASVITLADASCVAEVRVGGDVVYQRSAT